MDQSAMVVRRLAAAMLAALAACGFLGRMGSPAVPYGTPEPAFGEVSDSLLMRVIADGDLIVLGTPVDRESEAGLFTPTFQLGAKETWYSVKVTVDSVVRGKLKHAKSVDLGFMPELLASRGRFRLEPNDIIVQYPEVSSSRNRWAGAPPLIVGERAVFIFKRCYYCVELTGRPSRAGPYYKATPWVAMTWGSKLPPEEWPRVVRIVRERAR